jgi:hypothetical protein
MDRKQNENVGPRCSSQTGGVLGPPFGSSSSADVPSPTHRPNSNRPDPSESDELPPASGQERETAIDMLSAQGPAPLRPSSGSPPTWLVLADKGWTRRTVESERADAPRSGALAALINP